MKLYTRVQIALVAFALSLGAQTGTTVTATFAVPIVGVLPNGSCTFQAAATTSTPGLYRITGPPVTIPFTAGAFAAPFFPTDTSTPGGQYYSVVCGWPAQVANGYRVTAYSWPTAHIWLVPTSAGSVDILGVEVPQKPAATVSVPLAQIDFSGIGNGWLSVLNGHAATTSCVPVSAPAHVSQYSTCTISQM